MDVQRHSVGLNHPLLPHLAAWLLEHTPRVGAGDLSDVLVLLPSVRAAASLQHRLLEASEREALLLPRITTPKHLAVDLALRLDPHASSLPPVELRAALFTPYLKHLSWVMEHPESAPGLADELVELFDTVRRHDLQAELLEGTPSTAARPSVNSVTDLLWQKDLERVQEAWRAYREVIPADETDSLLAVDRAIGAHGWPGPVPEFVTLAGFAYLDPVTARLLRHVTSLAESHLFETAADDPLSRLFLASYECGPEDAEHDPTHPLHPARRVRALLLAGETSRIARLAEPSMPSPVSPVSPSGARSSAGAWPESYRERLYALEPAWREAASTCDIQVLVCDDPEDESRNVAALVVEEIANWRERCERVSEPPPRIAVATADRDLTRRIAAQLRDAGLDLDDTGGIPLSELPAGSLAVHLLQTIVTAFHHDPLLELLTHPFVDLLPATVPAPDPVLTPPTDGVQPTERREHARWTLRFEKMIRGHQRPITGLSGYQRRAVEYDVHVGGQRRPGRRGMSTFVEALAEAVAPLTGLTAGTMPWQVHLAGFRQAWTRLAPGRPLDPATTRQDEANLAGLLGDLDQALALAPPAARARFVTGFADFAAMLSRLIAARTVRPHRQPFRPVVVTGMLEARLEDHDLLIVSGLSEDVFPGRSERPLFLTDATRRRLGLPGWQEQLGLQAELFLRLLHNGRRTVLTWPTARLGQPCLPSPLVIRLGLSGQLPCTRAVPGPLYRRQPPPLGTIVSAQSRFAAEPAAIPAAEGSLRLSHLSHTTLKTYRDCPYRFLLESGYALREEEEILEEFRRLDYGTLVHTCLQRFLQPNSRGRRALSSGRREPALAALRGIASEVFADGADEMPQRRLWEETFLIAAPDVVDFELARQAAGWRPACLEARFTFTLGDLQTWLQAQPTAGEAVAAAAAYPAALSADDGSFPVKGTIDRIDRAMSGAGERYAVIDYKTGAPPSGTDVQESRDLQIVLYALALEVGGVPDLAGTAGAQVVQGAYYRIGPQECGFNLARPHLDAGETAGRAVLVQGAREILTTARAARDRTHPYALIPEAWQGTQARPLPCRICPFQGVCRLEERMLPPHVKRGLANEGARLHKS